MNFIIGQLTLIIQEEKIDQKMRKIFEIDFIKFETTLALLTISKIIQVSLNDMKISQYIGKNKNYETILFSEDYIIGKKKRGEDISLILFRFEHNIKLEKSPFSLNLNFGKQIYIIADYYYFYYLYNLFLKHISELDFNNLSALVNDKLTRIIKEGYDSLMKNRAIQEEKEENNKKMINMDISVIFKGPILLFPLYFQDEKDRRMLYISLGDLEM